jgi:hypothetical protein
MVGVKGRIYIRNLFILMLRLALHHQLFSRPCISPCRFALRNFHTSWTKNYHTPQHKFKFSPFAKPMTSTPRSRVLILGKFNLVFLLSKKYYNSLILLGSGNFGSCLADHLGDSNHDVFLWSRDASSVEHFNKTHKNLHYLKDHTFSSNIQMVGPDLPTQFVFFLHC